MTLPLAGARILAADWSDVFETGVGAWEDYTPEWTAAGTAPSLGNGTLVGSYMRVGRRLDFDIQLTMGSTTTFGSSAWLFSLPFEAVGIHAIGNARLIDASGSQYGKHIFLNSPTKVAVIGDTANSFVSSTTPFTWASGDILALAGTYEAAA